MNVCVICDKNIKTNEIKSCSVCSHSYHYTCLKITQENFLKESKAYKASWKCAACKGCDKRTGVFSPSRLSTAKSSTQALAEAEIEDIKNHFDTKLQESLANLLAVIRKDFSTESTDTRQKLQELTDSVNFLSSKCDRLEESLIAKNQVIEDLKLENSELRGDIATLSSRLEDIEQRSRDCNLEIQCVPEHKGENLRTIVNQIASITGCTLSDQELSNYHRVAKVNPKSERPRSIIVKFTSVLVRDRVLAAVKSYNRSHQSDKLSTSHLGLAGDSKAIYVCEHLSPANKKLHAAARGVAKEKGYEFVWVRSGKIFMRKNELSKSFVVKDSLFLDNLS